jgi:hypothetical protein
MPIAAVHLTRRRLPAYARRYLRVGLSCHPATSSGLGRRGAHPPVRLVKLFGSTERRGFRPGEGRQLADIGKFHWVPVGKRHVLSVAVSPAGREGALLPLTVLTVELGKFMHQVTPHARPGERVTSRFAGPDAILPV